MEVRQWRKDIDRIVNMLGNPDLGAQSPIFDILMQRKSLEEVQASFSQNFMDSDLLRHIGKNVDEQDQHDKERVGQISGQPLSPNVRQ